jgi:hypothetical protein
MSVSGKIQEIPDPRIGNRGTRVSESYHADRLTGTVQHSDSQAKLASNNSEALFGYQVLQNGVVWMVQLPCCRLTVHYCLLLSALASLMECSAASKIPYGK